MWVLVTHICALVWGMGSHDTCKEKAFCRADALSWKGETCRCGYGFPLGGHTGCWDLACWGVRARVLTGVKLWEQATSSMESCAKASSWGICLQGYNVPNRVLPGPRKPTISETWADVCTPTSTAVAFMRAKCKSCPQPLVEGWVRKTWGGRGYVFLLLYFFPHSESQILLVENKNVLKVFSTHLIPKWLSLCFWCLQLFCALYLTMSTLFNLSPGKVENLEMS